MRRAANIAAPLVTAAALSILTGCRPKEMQRCIDTTTNKVVDDSLCGPQQAQQPLQQRPDGHGGFFYYHPIYRPYYGGLGGYAIGDVVNGGSFNARPGVQYASPSSRGFFGGRGISRGGFGHSFSGGGE